MDHKKIRNKYPKKFLDIIESKLSKGDTLTEAIDLFERGFLSYDYIFDNESISLKHCKEREKQQMRWLTETKEEMIKYQTLWENSIKVVDEPYDSWYNYVLLDAKTKELVAEGSEQGNYSGGLTASKLNKNWDAKARMEVIRRGNPKLYFKIIGEQLREKEAD